MSLRDNIIKLAKSESADIVCFGSTDRFDKNDTIFRIMPEVKTVVCLAFRVLRGAYRGVEEGSTYYQYTTMGVANMEDTVMPMASLKVANLLEQEGFIALPQKRHQQIMAEENRTNPEVAYDAIYRGVTIENQMNFESSALKCGLGEMGLSGAILTDEYGPFIRYCFVLTDAVIEPTEIKPKHLCDGCKKCIHACPGHAINEDGTIDCWQCAVYYNGANGKTNPFMPPEAFADFDDRIEIIAGEADVTPDIARKILDNIYFYPPSQTYRHSICGRACDMECYVHLEEKGALTKKFNTPFRKRERWEFDIKDFE